MILLGLFPLLVAGLGTVALDVEQALWGWSSGPRGW